MLKGATAPKRAAWDTKGKLEDLTKQFESFRKEMLNKENMAQQVVEQKDQAIVKIECEMSEQVLVLLAHIVYLYIDYY